MSSCVFFQVVGNAISKLALIPAFLCSFNVYATEKNHQVEGPYFFFSEIHFLTLRLLRMLQMPKLGSETCIYFKKNKKTTFLQCVIWLHGHEERYSTLIMLFIRLFYHFPSQKITGMNQICSVEKILLRLDECEATVRLWSWLKG